MYEDFYADSHLRLFLYGTRLGLNRWRPYLDQYVLL